MSGYCERREGCVCGGDLPRIREGCSNWVKGPVLTDDEIVDTLEAAGVEWQWVGSPVSRRATCGTIDADKIIAGVRALLAKAQP